MHDVYGGAVTFYAFRSKASTGGCDEPASEVKALHIGVDLDNTILDATSTHLQYYNLASGQSFTPADVNDFYLYRLYGWKETERDAVYTKYGHDIHWNSAPLPLAAEILHELFARHRITIITARPPLFRQVTVDWLEHYKIRYHHIVLTENKLRECTRLGVDVLIDDGPHYAEEFARAGKPVILYEQPYNLSIASELVFRAAGWPEVRKHIERLDADLQK